VDENGMGRESVISRHIWEVTRVMWAAFWKVIVGCGVVCFVGDYALI
jgi:hypothetical protein